MAPHTYAFRSNRRMQSSCPFTHSSGLLSRSVTLLVLLLLCLYFPLGCAVSSSSDVASVQQGNQAATSTGVVTPQFFGMVVKNSAHQPAMAIGSRRLWDAGVTWAALEPAPGSFNWSKLDAEVSAAQATGAEVTLTLGMTPTWASSQPTLPSAYGLGATAMPRNLTDYDTYVAAVAARYQGRIATYEVWNDPSDVSYWSDTPAQIGTDMALLAAHAAAAVHGSDAAAKIAAPALDANGLGQFLAAGGSSSVDVFTAALSLSGQAPEAMVAELSSVRGVLLNTSAEIKPLWNDQPSWTLPAGGLSSADQAAYSARSLILNASFGIGRMVWYAWDENQATALQLSDSSAQPTQAAVAYGMMEGWLNGAAVNGCAANAQQLWSCQLVRSGQPAWVLWSAAGTVQVSSLGMTTMTDLEGNLQSVSPSGLVSVGAAPVLLQ